MPSIADGQDTLFADGYRAETWTDTGHFPHLEHPGRTAEAVIDWFQASTAAGPAPEPAPGPAAPSSERDAGRAR